MNTAKASSRALVIHTLPALVLFLTFLLTVCLVGFILASLAGYQHGTMLLHPDLFGAYTLVWPGQPIASVADYARQTPESHMLCFSSTSTLQQPYSSLSFSAAPLVSSDLTPTYGVIQCVSFPEDGVFRQIRVMIERDHVHSLTFESRGLQTDTLLLYWGTLDAVTTLGDNRRLSLGWDRSTYKTTALIMKPGFTVQSVTLTAKP